MYWKHRVLKIVAHVSVAVGVALTGISAVIAVLSYIISPVLTGKSWVIASPILLTVSAAVGATILWLYARKKIVNEINRIDNQLKKFPIYRVVRFLFLVCLGLIGFMMKVIFFAWIRQAPPYDNYGRESTADDIWDSHPKHYYDNEPPKPFS